MRSTAPPAPGGRGPATSTGGAPSPPTSATTCPAPPPPTPPHPLPGPRTVVPERLVGYARRTQRTQRRIVLCIDQSGSMAESVVYSSVFGAVLASLRSLSPRLVAFDTSVVDLTEQLEDPVEVLFGVQLGGGTDINQAIAYCQGLIEQP